MSVNEKMVKIANTIAALAVIAGSLCYTRIGYRSGMVSPSVLRSLVVNHKCVNKVFS